MSKNLMEAIENSGLLITCLELDGMELKIKVKRAEVIPKKEIRLIEAIENSGYLINYMKLDGMELELIVGSAEETPTETRDAYNVSFTVPACDINGLHFKELNVVNEAVQLLTTKQGRKIFCFENILFKSAIDENGTYGRAFSETPLGIYLENNFKNALQSAIKEKIESVSLLSDDNVFNEDSENYIPYFKNGAHRVKSFKDNTYWYWLNDHSRENEASFYYVSDDGGSYDTYASSVGGGVAPAFCIA